MAEDMVTTLVLASLTLCSLLAETGLVVTLALATLSAVASLVSLEMVEVELGVELSVNKDDLPP